ncbi:MAG: hypothetical protein MUO77_19295, partial [Anaerolineales bacterium]|nr:hypothetical protein [Anaerolineales bacterium]
AQSIEEAAFIMPRYWWTRSLCLGIIQNKSGCPFAPSPSDFPCFIGSRKIGSSPLDYFLV